MLSKPDIVRYVNEGRLRFDPPVPSGAITPVAVDLRLGRRFTSFRPAPAYLPAVYVDHSVWASSDLWAHVEADGFRLNPGQLVLAQTLERVSIPADLAGFVEGRSSWARVGQGRRGLAGRDRSARPAHVVSAFDARGRERSVRARWRWLVSRADASDSSSRRQAVVKKTATGQHAVTLAPIHPVTHSPNHPLTSSVIRSQ